MHKRPNSLDFAPQPTTSLFGPGELVGWGTSPHEPPPPSPGRRGSVVGWGTSSHHTPWKIDPYLKIARSDLFDESALATRIQTEKFGGYGELETGADKK